MPTDKAQQPETPGLGPPPSFGVADRTDKHMLPVATAMEDILNGDLDELAEMGADSGDLPAEALGLPELDSVPEAVAETPPDLGESPIAASEPVADNGGGRKLAIVGLLLAVAGVAIWAWLGGTDRAGETVPTQPDLAVANEQQPDADEPVEPAVDPAQPSPNAELKMQVARANNIAEMKASSYTARHTLLESLEREGATHRVDLDLHIALDLMQADQSGSPCGTFADALTLIEADPDRPSVAPALASVESVPARGARESADACEGLQQRLDALTSDAIDATDTPVTAPAESTKRPKSKRKRPSAPKAPKPNPDTTPKPANPPKPEPAATKNAKPNITKLDDELRG